MLCLGLSAKQTRCPDSRPPPEVCCAVGFCFREMFKIVFGPSGSYHGPPRPKPSDLNQGKCRSRHGSDDLSPHLRQQRHESLCHNPGASKLARQAGQNPESRPSPIATLEKQPLLLRASFDLLAVCLLNFEGHSACVAHECTWPNTCCSM